MNFTPKTEEQVQADQLCPVGKQPFTVMDAAVVLSKSAKNAGKEMFKLKLNVHAEDGDFHVYDYIAPWFMEYKFRHFFFCVGLGAEYEAGSIRAEQLPGREGWGEIVHKKANGEFGPAAAVKDYLPKNAKAAEATAAGEPDDVPF